MDQDVDFEYVPNLVEALTQQRVAADLVVGSFVNTPTVTTRMASLEPGIPGASPGSVWLPLAFSVPTIVYESDGPLADTDRTLAFDDLGNLLYGSDTHEDIEHPRFLLAFPSGTSWVILRSLGLNVTGDPNGDPLIDEAEITGGLETIRQWQERYHGSPQREREYRDHYLSEPWPRLLEKGRIDALYLPSDTLLGWDFVAEERWRFSILTLPDDTYFALDNVVYAGIPQASEIKGDALALLAWLADPDVQIDLISQKLVQRIDSFGFFGGFSVHERVTTSMMEDIYPGLAAHLFSPVDVILPEEQPRYWNEALERVVYPALDSPSSVDLRDELSRWYRQRGD